MPSNFTQIEYLIAASQDLGTKEGPCLDWPFKKTPKGYGHVYVPSALRARYLVRNEKGSGIVSRVSYIHYFGVTDLDVCHHCDRPQCFRPLHLFAGTPKDNMDDCIQKGRMRRGKPTIGPLNAATRLSDEDVVTVFHLKIRRLSNSQIGYRFGISASHVSEIISRKERRHVSVPQELIEAAALAQATFVHPVPLRGEDSPCSKLTNDEVIEMFRLRLANNSYRSLGQRFGIAPSSISQILHRKKWAYLEVPTDLVEGIKAMGRRNFFD